MLLNSKFLHKKGASPSVLVNIPVPAQRSTFQKLFLISRSIIVNKKPVNCRNNYVLKESKNVILVILFKVSKTIWTRVPTCQNGHATPLIRNGRL